MPFTKHGCSAILSHLFAKKKLSMFLVAYRATGAGVKEVFGGGYERLPVTDLKFEVANGEAANADDILFGVARRDWGDVVALGIVDEEGEEIAREDLTSVEVPVGKRLRIPAGKLVIKFAYQTP